MVRVLLTDPHGNTAWSADNISGTALWTAPENPPAGIWTLASFKASKGCMDDYYFGICGQPFHLFLSPEKSWEVPAAGR